MSKARKAQILTIGALVLAVGIAVWRKPRQPATPQDTVYAMHDASRAGNVRSYLASYTGQMRAALERSIRESGEERFSRYLKDSNSAVKGIALSEPEQLSDREVKLRAEYVYQDRNEAQVMYLENDGGAWKIARVDSAERVKTLIPYGTPVR